MLGAGEGGEQGNSNSSEIASRNDKRTSSPIIEVGSASAGLVATLQQEIHALVDSDPPETEIVQQLATKENVYDEHGNIIDVHFQQNNESRNLKSLLPGTYTIEFNEASNSLAFEKEDKIEVSTLGTQGRSNLSLLHEGGHMVDFHRNESRYQQLGQELLIAQLNEHLFYSKMLDARDSKNLMPGAISFVDKVIEDQKSDFTPEAIEEIKQAVDETSRHIAEEHSVEELVQLKDEQHDLMMNTSTRLKVQKERNAWANALHALRELKRQGINVFSGTKQDLFQEIDHALMTYEFTEGERLSSKDRHFTKTSI